MFGHKIINVSIVLFIVVLSVTLRCNGIERDSNSGASVPSGSGIPLDHKAPERRREERNRRARSVISEFHGPVQENGDPFTTAEDRKSEADDVKKAIEEEKVITLQKTVTILLRTVIDATGTAKGQKAEIDALKKVIENREEKVTRLEQKGADLSTKTSLHKAEMDDLKKKLENEEEKGSDLVKKVQAFESQLKQIESPVSAFRAEYDTKDKITVGKTLKFRDVKLNLGDNYNPTTGFYIAPTRGLYAFHLNVWTCGADWWIKVSIRVNGHYMATVYGRDIDNSDQSSLSTLLLLETGDKVNPYVRDFGITKGVDKLCDSHHSDLSGYLVQSL